MNPNVKEVIAVDRSTGEPFTAGLLEIVDDKTIRQHPEPGYEDLLRGIVDEGVVVDTKDDQVLVSSEDYPRQWFDGLPRHYSGSYLRVCNVD